MTTKPFDCVAMKHEIQQTLRSKYGHLTRAERNARIRETLRDDPHLSKLLRAAAKPQTQGGTG